LNSGVRIDGQLMDNSNSRIIIAYLLKKNGIGIDKFGIGIEVCYKRNNPQINLPFNFSIQKYFFRGSPSWNINYWE